MISSISPHSKILKEMILMFGENYPKIIDDEEDPEREVDLSISLNQALTQFEKIHF